MILYIGRILGEKTWDFKVWLVRIRFIGCERRFPIERIGDSSWKF